MSEGQENASASFPVGSRVRVFGLQAKPELNEREGRVASLPASNGRISVELEACPGPVVNVKPANLVLAKVPEERAELGADGVLVRMEGGTFNTMLDTARFMVNHIHGYTLAPMVQEMEHIHALRGSPQGQAILLGLTTKMYTYWTSDLPGFAGGVFPMIQETCDTSCATHKAKAPPGADAEEAIPLQLRNWSSAMKEDDVGRWGQKAARRYGAFWATKDTPEGMLLLDERDGAVYCALGIAETLKAPLVRMGMTLPVKIKLTLLPFRGRIVYDGLMAGENGPPEQAKGSRAAEILAAVEEAESNGAVVSNISAVGPLHEDYGIAAAFARKAAGDAEASEEAEEKVPLSNKTKKAVKGIKDLPKMPMPGGYWVARRFAYTEAENPNHMVIFLSGTGHTLGGFQSAALEPTAEELLCNLAKTAKVAKCVPTAFAHDSAPAMAGVRQALRGFGVRADYYVPAPVEETGDSTQPGAGE